MDKRDSHLIRFAEERGLTGFSVASTRIAKTSIMRPTQRNAAVRGESWTTHAPMEATWTVS